MNSNLNLNGIKGKLCSSCKEIKSWDEFTIRADNGRPISRCKVCINDVTSNPERKAELEKKRLREMEWRKTKPDLYRDRDLRRHHGITLVEYNAMYDKQGGRCAVCDIDATTLTRNMAVDHNHNTKQVRGLLCSKCNTAIGLIDEDIQRLDKIRAYLTNYTNENGVLVRL